jgi:hypothetical protein
MSEQHPHLGLKLVGEFSTKPKFRCTACGRELWTERSQRTGGNLWLVTKGGKHHFKKRCNMKDGDK